MDVDTGESVFVPVKVLLADSGSGSGGNEDGHAGNGGGGVGAANSGGAAGDTALSGAAEGAPGGGGGGVSSATRDRGEAAGTLSLVTPCLLPDLKEVSRISICSPRYFPVELDIAGNPAVAFALRRRCRIYVKRRVGHLSYKNVRRDKRKLQCLSPSFSL